MMSALTIFNLVMFPVVFGLAALNEYLHFARVLPWLKSRGERVDIRESFDIRRFSYTLRFHALLDERERYMLWNRLAMTLPWLVPVLGFFWIFGIAVIQVGQM